MKMLLTLPFELQEPIIELCDVNDLKNMACCSRQYKEAMKTHLWKCISVPSHHLSQDKATVETTKTSIYNSTELHHVMVLCIGVHPSGEINEGLTDLVRPVMSKRGKIEKSMEKTRMDNFMFLLNNCSKARVLHTCYFPSLKPSRTLAMDHLMELYLYWSAVTNETVLHVGHNCSQLQVLYLKGGHLSDEGLSSFSKLSRLRKLSFINITQVTDSGLDFLSELQELLELVITGCSNLSRAVFNHVCQLSCLERFEITGFGMFITNTTLSKFEGMHSLKEIATKFSTEITDQGFLQLCKLKKLEKLCLKHCVQVTEEALLNLNNLRGLKHLELCLSERVDVFVALQELKLDSLVVSRGYGVTDNVLSCISKLETLRNLSLVHCDDTTDAGIAHLAKLVNLQSLVLSYCGAGITDSGFSCLRELTKLQKLNIQGHPVNESLACISEIATLKELVVRNSSVTTNEGLSNLKKLCDLEILGVIDCDRITNRVFSHIRQIASLKELTISAQWVGDYVFDLMKPFALLLSLHKLDFGNCKLLTIASLSFIGDVHTLQHLDLRSCCKITDPGMFLLKKLKHLQSLNISACSSITDVGLSHLAALTSLKSLDISLCSRVTNEGLKSLAGLIHLQTLDCSYCELISDIGLEIIGSMCTLKELTMHNCPALTNAGLTHLRHLFQLEKLNLVDCYGISGQGLHQYLRSPHAGVNQLKHIPTIHY